MVDQHAAYKRHIQELEWRVEFLENMATRALDFASDLNHNTQSPMYEEMGIHIRNVRAGVNNKYVWKP